MTIGGLIQILKRYPEDARVVVTQNVVEQWSEYTGIDQYEVEQDVVGIIS